MKQCLYGDCNGYHPPCDNCGLAWHSEVEPEVKASADEEAQWAVEAKRFAVDKPYEEPA